MRLHRLRLAAFGPYATEQVIDFDRLAHGGLFLLAGPTGAGKTTILDAVTFALYGGLSGQDSADDRLRSHFAAPDAQTVAELELSLRGVRYKITRGPEYRRPKKRGDGFTTEASRVHLQRREGAAWVSVSANKAEAGELIAELVGLTRAQFTQVMLLPQGEFARFLRSSDDVRRTLLTKLFGTSLYDRITDELCDRRTEATRARERAERDICDALSAAAEAAGLGAGERAELLAAARAEQQTRLKELEEGLAQAIAITGAALAAAAEAAAAALAEDEEAKRQADLMTRLTQALTELRAHAETRSGHDQRARRLATAARRRPAGPRPPTSRPPGCSTPRTPSRAGPTGMPSWPGWRSRRPRRKSASPRWSGPGRTSRNASPRWKPGSPRRTPPRPGSARPASNWTWRGSAAPPPPGWPSSNRGCVSWTRRGRRRSRRIRRSWTAISACSMPAWPASRRSWRPTWPRAARARCAGHPPTRSRPWPAPARCPPRKSNKRASAARRPIPRAATRSASMRPPPSRPPGTRRWRRVAAPPPWPPRRVPWPGRSPRLRRQPRRPTALARISATRGPSRSTWPRNCARPAKRPRRPVLKPGGPPATWPRSVPNWGPPPRDIPRWLRARRHCASRRRLAGRSPGP